jgi:hypothetical protein
MGIKGPALLTLADLKVGDRIGFCLDEQKYDVYRVADWRQYGDGELCFGDDAYRQMFLGTDNSGRSSFHGKVFYKSDRGHLQLVGLDDEPERSHRGMWGVNAIDVVDVDAGSDYLFDIIYYLED